jgi:DNA-binding response OmpR family regulator
MSAALSRVGYGLMVQRANKMTTRNVETGPTGEYTTPPAEAMPVTPSILIAEEQPAIQDLLCWTLQLAGYHPIMCAGRQAALTWPDKAMAERDIPTVLLLDLSFLNTEEATDFLCHLRAHWQDTGGVLPQTIVLTTNPQVAAELGRGEYVLQKPFHVRNLLALIRQVTPFAS